MDTLCKQIRVVDWSVLKIF